ncbi:MAG: hypothetical protein OEU74_00290 [Gammaproteobacteria bacterium]|nr:hypothetical protein [Gammaproteobacteria bacterium]
MRAKPPSGWHAGWLLYQRDGAPPRAGSDPGTRGLGQMPSGGQIPANDCRLRYTSAMHSEFLYIVLLIAPWALVLVALFLYRQRRLRKTLKDSGDGRDGGNGRD